MLFIVEAINDHEEMPVCSQGTLVSEMVMPW